MKKKELEEKVLDLEEKLKELNRKLIIKVDRFSPPWKLDFDPECLHNGCHHERNPVCHLSCPHCSPIC